MPCLLAKCMGVPTYWCFNRFGIGPLDLLFQPFDFSPRLLPPFYSSPLLVWCTMGGSMNPRGVLSINGVSCARIPVSTVTCKLTYTCLLELSHIVLHCVEKFRPPFGELYWPSTWSQLFCVPLDRMVSDLASKVSHGVLFTMDCLVSFGYNHLPPCFCGFRLELVEHLFFNCALAKSGIDWIQSLLYWSAPLAPSILLCHVLFGFNPDELLVIPRVFVYLLHVLKFLIWN